MAKRFTDNEKWKKRFFKGLSTVNKLFFLYILDECDNAGIWHIETDVTELRIGNKLDLELAKKELGKHIFEFDNGEKWFIPFFIDFQYGSLNPSVNAHKSVIDKLKKRGLTKIYEQFINSSRTDMDKDKDKDKDEDKERIIESSDEPTIDKVKQYFKSMSFDIKQAENFYSYYSAQNWETTSGMNIEKTWQKKVIGWMNNQKQFTKYEKNERPPQPVKEKFCFCGKEARLWIDGIAGCSFEHCLEGKKLKKEK